MFYIANVDRSVEHNEFYELNIYIYEKYTATSSTHATISIISTTDLRPCGATAKSHSSNQRFEATQSYLWSLMKQQQQEAGRPFQQRKIRAVMFVCKSFKQQ